MVGSLTTGHGLAVDRTARCDDNGFAGGGERLESRVRRPFERYERLFNQALRGEADMDKVASLYAIFGPAIQAIAAA